MNNEDKIIDYLNGQMSYDEKIEFENLMSMDADLKETQRQYAEIYGELESHELQQPSRTLKANFDYVLEQEIERTKKQKPAKQINLHTWRNIASVAAVLVIGILVGQNWTQQRMLDQQTASIAAELKQNMRSESVTGRIEALQVSQKFEQPENEILNTLLETLQNDQSPNVRLAAAEALNQHASEDRVRAIFIQQLSNEKDPFVLIELINTLGEQKVEKAIDPLQELTTAEDVAKFIKDEAHMGLIKIEKI